MNEANIKAAFARGYLNKQEEHGFEKNAFLLPLLGSLVGGMGVSTLATKFLAPRIGAWAERSLLARNAAAIKAGTTSVEKVLGTGRTPGENTGVINQSLSWLRSPQAAPVKVNGKMRQYAGSGVNDLTGQLGFTVGTPLGTAAGEALQGRPKEQQVPQDPNQYQPQA